MTGRPRTPPAIRTAALCCQFGPVRALDRVDLEIGTGETVALFGPNGAGKTTLVRILSLALRPNAGTFSIQGLDPRRDEREIRSRTGVISHSSFLYAELTARENLEFFARLYGVADPAARSLELLEQADLSHRGEEPVGVLSRGMQQRVSVARALVHDPPIVLLDEPFTGLDPRAAGRLAAILGRLKERGRTILLTTHDLRQGLAMSERWLLLDRGRLAGRGRSATTDASELEARCFAEGSAA